MMWLPDGGNSFKIGLAFDTIPACDIQSPSHVTYVAVDIYRAMLRVARVKISLYIVQ